MKSEVFGEANVVRRDLLDAMPSALDYVIQDMTHKLADRVMCEMENGELICSLQNVEQHQFSASNSVEISRKVKLKRLVRCKDCKHGSKCPLDIIQCKVYGVLHSADWFCADGEEKSNG